MPVVVLFDRMSTQWTVGFGGPIGLRYEALTDRVWSSAGIRPSKRQQAFEDLRLMEEAALEQVKQDAEDSERKGKKHG